MYFPLQKQKQNQVIIWKGTMNKKIHNHGKSCTGLTFLTLVKLVFLRVTHVIVSNLLIANLIKRSNTLKKFVGNFLTSCLSVFDHFLGLALQELIIIWFCKEIANCQFTESKTYLYQRCMEVKFFLTITSLIGLSSISNTAYTAIKILNQKSLKWGYYPQDLWFTVIVNFLSTI